MAYARFGYSDVYVFMNTGGYLDCCGCILGSEGQFFSTQAMVDHLADHRAAGHDVPPGIEEELWEDDRDNWVDYRRCDVRGCEKRVTCGSPTPSGYVWACSIAHAQSLGGFADMPGRTGDTREEA